MVAMRVVGCRIGLILFLVLSGVYGGAAWAQQCAVRIGVLGQHNNAANIKAARTICESADFNCTYTELGNTTFNGMSVDALRANFDVLLFSFAPNNALNADWATRLLPFLNQGGGIIYEQPGALSDLHPGVEAINFDVTITTKPGTDFAEIVITDEVSGLTDGILDGNECTGSGIKTCFANTHIGFTNWQAPLVPFLEMTGRRGKTNGTVVEDPLLASWSGTVVGLRGVFSGGGRMVLSGPDNNFHGVRNEAANRRGRNQYNLLLNALRWVSPGCEPENEAPAVNAGADRSVPLSTTLTLAGSASDDGLPDPPGTLTVTWTQVSGPGNTDFDDPSAAQTTATFSSAGTYILRLTADDSELSDSDNVTVTVTPPDPENEAPVVNAGADRSVPLSSTLTLAGSASDDGLPDPPGTLTVTWTQVSGPGNTDFDDPSAAQTTATFSSAGTYILRLTADDSELSDSDDVTVTVTPQDPPVRIGVLGAHTNAANIKAARTICESADFNCTYTELGNTTFNGMSVDALRANFDVLLFSFASNNALNADWATRLLPFLNQGGGIIYEQPGALSDLHPGVEAINFDVTITTKPGTDFAEIVITDEVSGLTDGILDGNECINSQIKTCFANTHIGFTNWQAPLVPFLEMTGRRGKTDGTVVEDPLLAPWSGTVVGLRGVFSGGGRMVLSGPDNNFHGVRNDGAGARRGRNQYNLLLNALRWVSQNLSQ